MENTKTIGESKSSPKFFETGLYVVSALSLLLVLVFSILYNNNIVSQSIIYWIAMMFILSIFIYSFYTVQKVVNINEDLGKSSYFGIVLFYSGFIAILWTAFSGVINLLLTPTNITSNYKTLLDSINYPLQHPELLWSGLGLSLTGILIEITNIDEFFLRPIWTWIRKLVSPIYRVIGKVTTEIGIFVFYLALFKPLKIWPYDRISFAVIAWLAWTLIFTPGLYNDPLKTISEKYQRFTISFGIVMMLVSRELSKLLGYDSKYFIITGLGFIIIGLSKPLIKFSKKILPTLLRELKKLLIEIFEKIREKPVTYLSKLLVLIGVILVKLSIMWSLLPIYYCYLGIVILVIGVVIDYKPWINPIIKIIKEAYNEPYASVVINFGFIFVLFYATTDAINNRSIKDTVIAVGIFVFLIIWDYKLIINTYRYLRRILPLMFKQIKEHLREILEALRRILRFSLLVEIFYILLIEPYHQYYVYLLICSILLIVLLDYKAFLEKPRQNINFLGFILLIPLTWNYLVIFKEKVILYLIIADVGILIVNNSTGLWKALRSLFTGVYNFIIRFSRFTFKALRSIFAFVWEYIGIFAYFFLEVLLIIYAFWIIFAGDPLHLFNLQSIADRLSFGGGIILLALASNWLLSDRIKKTVNSMINRKTKRRYK